MIEDEWQSGTKGKILLVVLGIALAIMLIVGVVLWWEMKPWLVMY